MNIPTVFVSSLCSGEQSLAFRWEVARILNTEGILTDFNRSQISTSQTDTCHMCTPLTLFIDEYGYFKIKNNLIDTEDAIMAHDIVSYIHNFIRSGAP